MEKLLYALNLPEFFINCLGNVDDAFFEEAIVKFQTFSFSHEYLKMKTEFIDYFGFLLHMSEKNSDTRQALVVFLFVFMCRLADTCTGRIMLEEHQVFHRKICNKVDYFSNLQIDCAREECAFVKATFQSGKEWLARDLNQ